jgi:hypothetical protein
MIFCHSVEKNAKYLLFRKKTGKILGKFPTFFKPPIPSSRHPAIPPSRHPVILSSRQPAIQASRHPVILSSRQPNAANACEKQRLRQ